MIRKYENTDIEAVMDTWWQASSLAHPFLPTAFTDKVRKDMRELYLPNSETWVYEQDKLVIGFIAMIDNEIGGLFVRPDQHAKGVGTTLVNYVQTKHTQLEVEVFQQNTIGRAFYDKYGFYQIKEFDHEASGQVILRMRFDP